MPWWLGLMGYFLMRASPGPCFQQHHGIAGVGISFCCHVCKSARTLPEYDGCGIGVTTDGISGKAGQLATDGGKVVAQAVRRSEERRVGKECRL